MPTNESTKDAPVKEADDQAVHFVEHPGVKAIIIPLWMIEKIQVDLHTAPQELVVQLIERDSIGGEENETD